MSAHRGEEAAEALLRQYARIVGSMAEAIISVDRDGTILTWNPAAERIYGYRAEEIIGRTITITVPPEKRSEHQSVLRAAQEGRDTLRLRTERLHKDGKSIPLELSIAPVRTATGEVESILAWARDLSPEDVLERERSALWDLSLDLLATLDEEGRFLDVSPQWTFLLGWHRREILGRFHDDLVHPDDKGPAEAQPSGAPDGTVSGRELRLLHKEGGHRTFLWNAVRDSPSRRTYVVARDVTERVREREERRLLAALAVEMGTADTVVEALRIYLQRLGERVGAALAEAWTIGREGIARFATCWQSADGGSEAWEERCRRERFARSQGLVGRAWSEQRAVWVRDVAEDPLFTRRDLARAFGLHGALAVPVETEGELVSVAIFFFTSPRDRDAAVEGTIRAVSAQLGGVIAKKEAETSLRDSERRFRALAEAAPDVVLGVDAEGRIDYANVAAEQVLGWTPHSLRGRRLADIVPIYRPGPLLTTEGRTAGPPGPVKMDAEAIAADGRRIPIELALSPVSTGGTRAVVAIRDLTERRHAEKERARLIQRESELERLRAIDVYKTQFINHAAHELLTPLTPVVMQTQILQIHAENDQDERLARVASILQRNVDRLSNTVQDLMTVTKHQAGELALHPTRVDAVQLLRRVAHDLEPKAASRRVAIQVRAPPSLELIADPQRVEQAIKKFVDNGVRFSPPGEQVVLSAQREGEGVSIQVWDRGEGVPPEKMHELFTSFGRTHDPQARTDLGAGLGLYVARIHAEDHGGQVDYAPNPEGGSIFSMWLPDEPTPKPSQPAL